LLQLVDGQICFAAADQPLVQALIRARRLMHEHVYQRPDVKGFELMLAATLQDTEHCLELDWLKQHAHLDNLGFAEQQTL
jgi:HD superfamily phosphohydrolase